MSLQNQISAVSTFIDSLGVVIARLFVVGLICLFTSSPAIVGTYFLSIYFPQYIVYATAYLFYAFVAFILIAFLMRFKEFASPESKTSDHPFIKPTLGLMITIFPFVTLFFLLLNTKEKGDPFMFTKKHYINDVNVIIMLFYLVGLTNFALGVYLVGQDASMRSIFFEANFYPTSLRSALLFTLDIAIRGFFFDFFEHFNIRLSEVELTQNLLGKGLTYLLRLSSLVLAINLVLEMVSGTREKLKLLEVHSSVTSELPHTPKQDEQSTATQKSNP